MNISKTQTEGKTILTLSGRLDTTTAPQLQEALLPEFDEPKEIELDFTELAYVSSAGLRVLLIGEKTAKVTGGRMTLAHVPPDIMEIFSMTGFVDILHIVSDE
jgi:anti-anti-sigma factor